ncbi:BCCT family transporter [Limosilactobacillus reuteri]|uniref:BCCT family transporter n=1 Tax=Limosilactobacillus reuteri TaxID=1598 RepID=UPI00098FE900|nr:BCCT family transporter [Limosilactobacillus reuteri]WOZ75023.1 BCCT family transporter [Limosilactobacillus reuteri]
MLKNKLKLVDWQLLIIPVVCIFALSGFFITNSAEARKVLEGIRSFFSHYFSFYYVMIAIVFFGGSVLLAFSKYGKIKLGNGDPEYSSIKWGMMIFTSTMSADIIFYSLSEWMMYSNESFIKNKSGSHLEWALTYSLFHWGPIAWSFYIFLAVAFGYMLYVTKNRKQKFSEACRPILKHKTDGALGKIIDLVAIFSLIAATATTFSMSMPLLAASVGSLLGIKNQQILSLGLLCAVVGVYLVISILGMKAMSRLSIIAFSVFGLLIIYVLLFSGQELFISSLGLRSLGNLVVNFPQMTVITKVNSFTENWTIYYWSYWMVWCVATPFFIGSISKGRTIRNLIFGGYAWGLAGTYLSFIVLSGFGISRQTAGIINAPQLLSNGSTYAEVIIQLLQTLPNYQLVLILLILAMVGLYSTVFDSITMVISKYSYKSLSLENEPSKLMRGFWAVIFIILPIALLFNNDSIYDIQSVAIITAIPTGFVMLLIIASFWKEVRGKQGTDFKN